MIANSASQHARTQVWGRFFARPGAKTWILALSAGAAAFGLVAPYFQKLFIDAILAMDSASTGAAAHPAIPLASPLGLLLSAFFCALLGSLANLAATYYATIEAVELQRSLAELLYTRMLEFRSQRVLQKPVGEMVSIYASDLPGAGLLLEQCLPQFAAIFFPLALAPIAMTYLFQVPARLIFEMIAAVSVINTLLAMRQARYFYFFKKLAADRTALVSEWVQNIRTLRILGWVEAFERKIFYKREEETKNRLGMVTNGQLMNSLSSSVTFLINVVALYAVIHRSGHQTTPGELLALFWVFGVFLTRPFRQMPWFFTVSLDALSSIRRLQDFLASDEARKPQAREPTVKAPAAEAFLAVRQLNLRLNGAQLLSDVSFELGSDELVAVVGEVGSGKSLLLLSLLGETEASFGDYHIDGKRVALMSPSQLRAHFGFVPQEGFVMSASLRENVGFNYNVEKSLDPQIKRALEIAHFQWQRELGESKLDKQIGERGVNLSGGQRQRLSLARSAFLERGILLLDDCLSALDFDTERLVLEDLVCGAWRKKARLLVTHRLSVLARVDRILFMDQGRIVESGKFVELVARSEKFRLFAASVLGGDRPVPNSKPLWLIGERTPQPEQRNENSEMRPAK